MSATSELQHAATPRVERPRPYVSGALDPVSDPGAYPQFNEAEVSEDTCR
jgi:hypothetical protein